MNSNNGVLVVHRSVKHARLRVHEDERVELIVPSDFTQAEIRQILDRKSEWIRHKQDFFRTHPRRELIPAKGEIVLLGEKFRFILEPQLGHRAVLDEKARTVTSGRCLHHHEERRRWYRGFARKYLHRRVRELSREYRLPYSRVFVRAQRTKWGSCSKAQNISLNWQLIAAPKHVIDYVILHELMHTRLMKHTSQFRVGLSAICPDQTKAIEWLQQNSPHV